LTSSHSIGKSKGNYVKGKYAQKTTDVDTVKIRFLLVPQDTKISNPKANPNSCYFKTNIYGKFLLHPMMLVHYITGQYVPPSEERS